MDRPSYETEPNNRRDKHENSISKLKWWANRKMVKQICLYTFELLLLNKCRRLLWVCCSCVHLHLPARKITLCDNNIFFFLCDCDCFHFAGSEASQRPLELLYWQSHKSAFTSIYNELSKLAIQSNQLSLSPSLCWYTRWRKRLTASLLQLSQITLYHSRFVKMYMSRSNM